MDFNLVRSMVTVLSFVVFLGILVWTFNRSRLKSFDEAAQLPFLDSGTSELDMSTSLRRGGSNQ